MTIIEGRKLGRNLEEHADVVVIGSGAGGAVVAKELAEAGLDVIVLEEGPYVPGSEYGKLRPTESLRRMGREAGTTAVFGIGDTPLITVMAGRVIGGSSVLTGGVCFRVPSIIHHRWVKDRGLTMLSERDLEQAFLSVEAESHVETVPENMQSEGTKRFMRGAQSLGIPMKPLRRNTKDCCGCSRCNFGCPHGAKLSVDVTYLPKAIRAGARVYSDCLAEEIVSLGGRARGVRGAIVSEDETGKPIQVGKFYIRASTIVVAAGSMHSPLLLMRSGFRSRALGKHLTLHPGFRVVARFNDPVYGWRGALQSAYTDHFEHQGITLTGLFVPPNVLAAAMPGVGRAFHHRVSQVANLAIFGGIVHDEGGGRIFRGIGREPLIFYRLSKENKAALIRGIQILSECFFAGGAREVYLPIFGSEPLRNGSEIKQKITDKIPARRIECVTFHPLGSCRIALDPNDGVVDPWGKTHELDGVYVADGSVVPTSIGVNSQLPIMAMAARIAWRLRDTLIKGRSRNRLVAGQAENTKAPALDNARASALS